MYGLVNRAIQELLCDQFGPDTWEQIKRKAGVDTEVFVRMDSYPDEITYRLVGAASEVLDIPQTDILKKFGCFWTEFTGQAGYGEMMDAAGSSLWEFLNNLDDLHSRVGLMYPKLNPPSFRCEKVSDQSMIVHYESDRPGLAPLVIGLLEGLSKRFDTPINIEHLECTEDIDHDRFMLTQV